MEFESRRFNFLRYALGLKPQNTRNTRKNPHIIYLPSDLHKCRGNDYPLRGECALSTVQTHNSLDLWRSTTKLHTAGRNAFRVNLHMLKAPHPSALHLFQSSCATNFQHNKIIPYYNLVFRYTDKTREQSISSSSLTNGQRGLSPRFPGQLPEIHPYA